jgi:DNA-directed RNA polymerase beta' subunit
MSFDEINAYIEAKHEREKYDFNMRYYQAIMTMAKEPKKAYQEIYNQLFKKQNKEQSEEEMKAIAKQITLMYGGKIIEPQKGGGV